MNAIAIAGTLLTAGLGTLYVALLYRNRSATREQSAAKELEIAQSQARAIQAHIERAREHLSEVPH